MNSRSRRNESKNKIKRTNHDHEQGRQDWEKQLGQFTCGGGGGGGRGSEILIRNFSGSANFSVTVVLRSVIQMACSTSKETGFPKHTIPEGTRQVGSVCH